MRKNAVRYKAVPFSGSPQNQNLNFDQIILQNQFWARFNGTYKFLPENAHSETTLYLEEIRDFRFGK